MLTIDTRRVSSIILEEGGHHCMEAWETVVNSAAAILAHNHQQQQQQGAEDREVSSSSSSLASSTTFNPNEVLKLFQHLFDETGDQTPCDVVAGHTSKQDMHRFLKTELGLSKVGHRLAMMSAINQYVAVCYGDDGGDVVGEYDHPSTFDDVSYVTSTAVSFTNEGRRGTATFGRTVTSSSPDRQHRDIETIGTLLNSGSASPAAHDRNGCDANDLGTAATKGLGGMSFDSANEYGGNASPADTEGTASPPLSTVGPMSTTTAASSLHSSKLKEKRMRKRKQRQLIQQCRQKLFSANDDTHVQLHRRATVTRKEYLANSIDVNAPPAGLFNGTVGGKSLPTSGASSPPLFGGASKLAAEVDFTFVDVTGKWKPDADTTERRKLLLQLNNTPPATLSAGKEEPTQAHNKASPRSPYVVVNPNSPGVINSAATDTSSHHEMSSEVNNSSALHVGIYSDAEEEGEYADNAPLLGGGKKKTTRLSEHRAGGGGYGSTGSGSSSPQPQPALPPEAALTAKPLSQVVAELEESHAIGLPLLEVTMMAQAQAFDTPLCKYWLKASGDGTASPQAALSPSVTKRSASSKKNVQATHPSVSEDQATQEWCRNLGKALDMRHITAKNLGGVSTVRHQMAKEKNTPLPTARTEASSEASSKQKNNAMPLDPIDSQHIFVFDSASSFLTGEATSSILPPSGSAQRRQQQQDNRNFLVLALDSFLQSTKGKSLNAKYYAPWILYVDTAKKIVVTIRPTDCIAMGRIRMHWAKYFSYVGFDAFVWLLIGAAVENFKKYLDDAYTIMDECETLMAPSMLDKTKQEAAGRLKKKEEKMQRFRKRMHSTLHYAKHHSALDDDELDSFAAGTTFWAQHYYNKHSNCKLWIHMQCHKVHMGVRKAVRWVVGSAKPKRRLPAEITVAAVRLQNLVYRQASVYFRCLGKSRHTMCRVAAALKAAKNGTTGGGGADELAGTAAAIVGSTMLAGGSKKKGGSEAAPPPTKGAIRGGALGASHHQNKGGAFSSVLFDSSSSDDDDDSLISALGCGSSDLDFNPVVANSSESADPISLSGDLMERCRTTKRQASEMMDLTIALSTSFYDDNVAILAVVQTVSDPLVFLTTMWGMNFTDPTSLPAFSWYYGYWFAWGLMIVLAIAVLLLLKFRLRFGA